MAAVVAASSRPNEVPKTESRAFFITSSTVLASCPKPWSLDRASSMALRREKPLAMTTPIAAMPVASPAVSPSIMTLLILPPNLSREPSMPCGLGDGASKLSKLRGGVDALLKLGAVQIYARLIRLQSWAAISFRGRNRAKRRRGFDGEQAGICARAASESLDLNLSGQSRAVVLLEVGLQERQCSMI